MSADRESQSPTQVANTTPTLLGSAGSEILDLHQLSESASGFELTASLYPLLVARGENEPNANSGAVCQH